MIQSIMKIAVSGVFASAIAAGTAIAGEDAAPKDAASPAPVNKHVCLNAGDIDHLSYPDDNTILFHMRGGNPRIWRNELKRSCPGLKFEQAIVYEINGGTVCGNMQVVYVMHRWTPCMLGPFTPYTPPAKDTGEKK